MDGRKSLTSSIAKERIDALFELAEKNSGKEPKLAASYIKTLDKIRKHYRVGLPTRIKARICAGCSELLVPGVNCTVRLASSKKLVVYRCTKCGRERRIPYKK